jgi:hypothetical protein
MIMILYYLFFLKKNVSILTPNVSTLNDHHNIDTLKLRLIREMTIS